jgi:methylated-DNA-protein-cysteine methyltransferase-like protein
MSFKDGVIKLVNSIPEGMVTNYGEVALALGQPRAARQVGWVLNSLERTDYKGHKNIPWWRVVNKKGFLSIKGTKKEDKNSQKFKLLQEGVQFKDEYTVDLEHHMFKFNYEQK